LQTLLFALEKSVSMRVLKSITAILLLLLVFFANTGVVITKHRCKMRGERIFIFTKPSDFCCSQTPKSQTCSVQATTCCLEQNNFYKLTSDFQFSCYSLDLGEIQSNLIAILESKSIFLLYKPLTIPNLSNFPNPPPLPAGKTLLLYIATFLI
jgi:hypothetical protein